MRKTDFVDHVFEFYGHINRIVDDSKQLRNAVKTLQKVNDDKSNLLNGQIFSQKILS